MLNPISNKIGNAWESWNIRVVILVSLYLQIFLTMCSPLRKRINNPFLKFSIWSAYLMADSAALFCVGHIASSQASSNKLKINTHNHLLALWAPFLLVHLGGPDTITAFSLEDNQLWRRHMLGFVVQFLFCAFVFLLTMPGNRLWIPIVLVFVAGMIKYGERVYAMYVASNRPTWLTGEAITKLTSIDEGVITNTRFKKNFTTKITNRLENKLTPSWYIPKFRRSYVVKIRGATPQDTLKLIENKLSKYYDTFFTKFRLRYGYHCRFVTFGCLSTALGLFVFKDQQYKQGLDPFDVRVTYTLLYGAVALDIIALLMHLFSDGVVEFFNKYGFSFPERLWFVQWSKRPKWSKCKKNPYTKFKELSTSLPFLRWSGSISGFNLISYGRYMRKPLLHYINKFFGIFTSLHVEKNPFLFELWEFILEELNSKLEEAPDIDIGYRILQQQHSSISEESRAMLMPYMMEIKMAWDECLIVWHIATHLCYVQELDNNNNNNNQVVVDEQEFSKLLSDYMMYLLVLQSDMIFVRGFTRIKEILYELEVEVKPYFIKEEDEVEACKKFVTEHAKDKDIIFNSFWTKALKLANELEKISVKWEIISRVWVELLSLAARECGSLIHFQHLSEGGELISLVWLLMDHLQLFKKLELDLEKLKDLEEPNSS
ncbi:hypothetical protein RIF29_00113 [Crotalaria pallida]|uniref:DUF4220 domain-containing protein n=1 Tax=Crotalaria pallida TaxID=3830 RepID=A0AAN9IVV7_CROPI